MTGGAAAVLGLSLTTGPAAGASTRAAGPAAPLHTYYVAPNGTDTSGSCTANTASNAFPAIAAGLACAVNGDAISLAPTGTAPYQGFGTVSHNITISAKSGANARTVTVDAANTANLTVAAGATVTVTGLTIDGSNAGLPNVTNNGTLTLTRDTITGNLGNGGILNSGTSASLTLNASTVSGNINGGAQGGGGISSSGSLSVNNSTIAGNSSGGTAEGGVEVSSGSSATFVNSTIAGNTSAEAAGGLRAQVGATVTLSNTLIAGNTGSTSFPDCDGILADGPGGHNLIGNPSTGCSGLTNGVNGDQLNASAGLMPLANNGGPTNTVAVVAGSPAVGTGNPVTCAQAPVGGKDQRGRSRNIASHGCDIGAYDTGGKTVSLHTYYVAPNGTDTSGSCTANTASNAFPTIAAGLACATDGDTISLAPTGTTPYAGFGTVSHDVTIAAKSGANARTVVVNESAGLTVAAGSDVVLTGVTLNGSGNFAGPDVTNNGVLTLNRDTVADNPSDGGIVNDASGSTDADLTLNATTVTGNVGDVGGAGITQAAGAGGESLRMNNSTVAGNLGGTAAAGVVIERGTGTFVNSTITGNQSSSAVGGLVSDVGTGAVVLSNTIIAANTGGVSPDCRGTLTDGPGGHNLIGNATGCTGLTNGVNGDQVNVAAPGLGSLANNGGPTDTAALATGSPAMGAGNAATCEQAPIANKDQRGDSRNATTRGGCDIGAYDTGGAS